MSDQQQFLVIRNSVVVNVVVGERPDGYRPETDVFVPRAGDNAGAWIDWADPGTGVLVPPPPLPEPETEPEA